MEKMEKMEKIEHVHITIAVVVNGDTVWINREPRGRREMELKLPKGAAYAINYNKIFGDLIAQTVELFDAECTRIKEMIAQ